MFKQANEISKLYEEVVTYFNDLADLFELNHPIEIYTLYRFLLYKGYLSKDKKFNYLKSQNTGNFLSAKEGVNILTGQGDRSNVVSMLRDIYKNRDLFSTAVSIVKSECFVIFLSNQKNTTQTPEDIMKIVTDYTKNEKEIEFYRELFEGMNYEYLVEKRYLEDPNPRIRRKGNYLITSVRGNDVNFFLDPVLEKVYGINDRRTHIIEEGFPPMKIAYQGMKSFESRKTINEFKEGLHLPAYDNEYEIGHTTKIKLFLNEDKIEDFHKQNSELYEEVTDKVYTLEKKISIISQL